MDDTNYVLKDHWKIRGEVRIKFSAKLRPELVCTTCNAITPRGLKDVRGHVYCLNCLDALTDGTDEFTCQECSWQGPRTQMQSCEEEWKTLEMKGSVCPNENHACCFTGALKTVLEHYISCDAKGKAVCSLCKQLLPMKALARHIEKECPRRILECNFCSKDVVFCEKLNHEANCEERPAQCEHCGERVRTYNKLKNEHYTICPKMPLCCVFQALGCPYRAPRYEMNQHMSQSRHDHLFIDAICKLREENKGLKKFIQDKLTTEERNREGKIKQLESNMAHLQGKASTESSHRETLAKRLDQVQHELEALKASEDACSQRIAKHITKTESSIERLDQELHLKPIQPGFEHVWKIQPFFSLKNAAMTSSNEISSGVVYINKPGYAVEFIVGFPRLFGRLSTPNLSFKCRIHAGDFDAMLPWPFKNKLILILLNQQSEASSQSFELDPKTTPEPLDGCFKRPESGQPNAKFGFSEVLSIPKLENAKKGFLLHNCVVFKIVVP